MKRSLAAYEAARNFAALMGQDPLEPRGTFVVRSKSRRDCSYEMLHTPEGYAVHQGEGCEGETFNGPLGCWHSKDYSVHREEIEDMTQAMTTYQGGAVALAREFTPTDIDTLKATICKGASDAELRLFVATCQHTGLDPFMRQIHAVMRRSRVNDQWVETMTIQIGIDGFRLIANRTGEMQGMDGPQWTYDGKTWEDLPREDDQPLASRCAVWRKNVERPFVAVIRWSAYAQTTRDGLTAMWKRMGPEMLAKCAEALALRRAFPAEMASLPSRPDFVDSDEVDMERQEWTPAPDAIESTSRVVEDDDPDEEHEATQQAPVSASDGASVSHDVPSPAASSPDEDKATDAQLAQVAEWTEALKAKGKAATDAVDAARRAEWPYAVVNGRFSAAKLTEAHCTDYIAVLADAAVVDVKQTTLV